LHFAARDKSTAIVFLSESSPSGQRPKKSYVIRRKPDIRYIRKKRNDAESHSCDGSIQRCRRPRFGDRVELGSDFLSGKSFIADFRGWENNQAFGGQAPRFSGDSFILVP
jgi:hypothetical protein